ncbi:hypothetical protein E1264_36185 [Actinomadura sp. KC216]|uniref:hypothetical protein n=1 Tax=Actinomadura sp. KC216 TaxID=2530370 RepID=UPI001048A1AF|nr:hypothetical protein [Actinomadura sp. KC216]TDB78976.1 hypothetical protein E1264_36185 [Actinomadura sp. KC216]
MGHLAEMAKIALDVSTVAAFIIPTAWPSVAVMYMAQSDPAQLWDAAEDWKKTVDKIKSARDKIDDELRTLPDDSWYGKDRDAFEKKMHDYANQLMLAFAYAFVMFIVLTVMALLIAVFIMTMLACALVLAYFAAWVLIARLLVPVPGYGQAHLAAAEAAARSAALSVRHVLRTAEGVLQKAGTACAAAIGAATGVDVVGQMLTGNTNAFPDFFEATVRSVDDVAISRLALIEQKITGQFMRGRAFGGTGYGKFRLPMVRLPQKYRSLWSGLGGAKGVADTGLPYAPEGVANPGAPWINKGITSVTGKEGYGDDYVKRTNPIPADTDKGLD